MSSSGASRSTVPRARAAAVGEAARPLRSRTLPVTSIFYAFRDSPQRRRALSAPPGLGRALRPVRARRARGARPRDPPQPRAPGASGVGASARRIGQARLERAGGYGGDFATVLGSLRVANRADVVFSTVDTVGIPLCSLAGRRTPAPRRSSTRRSGCRSASRSSARSACERLYARALCGLRCHARVQRSRGRRTSTRGSRSTAEACACRVRPVRCRRGRAPSDARRPHRTTSYPSAPIRTATSSCFSRSRGDFPTSASPSSRRDGGRAPLSDAPANVTIEVDLPFEQHARAARAEPASSRCRCARTRTRARRPSPAGHGAREARRRQPNERDRDRLRARRRRELPARRAGRRVVVREALGERPPRRAPGTRARRAARDEPSSAS